MNEILRDEEKMKVMQVFESLDVEQQGFLSKENIINAYKLIGEDISQVQLDLLYLNKDNQISYSEWMLQAIDKEVILTNKYLKQAFDLLNTKKDGYLNKQELSKIFKYQEEQGRKIMEEMISQFDLNGDRLISFQEFQLMMINYSKKNQKENLLNKVQNKFIDPFKQSEEIEDDSDRVENLSGARTRSSFPETSFGIQREIQERKGENEDINYYCTGGSACNIY